jgi:hypothetical protein
MRSGEGSIMSLYHSLRVIKSIGLFKNIKGRDVFKTLSGKPTDKRN